MGVIGCFCRPFSKLVACAAAAIVKVFFAKVRKCLYLCNEGIWCDMYGNYCHSMIKTKIYMENKLCKSLRRILCLAAMLVVLPVFSIGQNTIYELGNMNSKFSIVRHYQNDIDITYGRYGNSDNCFNYIDRANLAYFRADIDFDINVTDFQIHSDRVFFCGSYRNSVIIGWFKIYDLFFGGGVVNYAQFPIITQTYPIPNGTDMFSSLRKIKVYENNGNIHLFLIGEGQNSSGNVKGPHSLLVDAWTSNLSTWDFMYTMDYSDEHTYDDLTVTSNYLVVAAHNIGAINPMAPNILYYALPSPPYNSIFATSIPGTVYTPTYWTGYAFIKCTDRLLITDISGDYFVTVCPALYRESVPVMVVTYYQDPLSWPIDRYIYSPHSSYSYSEIAYNRQKKSLYMLNPRELAKLGSTFANLDIYTTNSPYNWLSIDTLDINGDAVVSGFDPYDGYTKKLWQFNESIADECVGVSPWNISNEIEYRGESPKLQYIFGSSMNESYIVPEVRREVLIEICK